MDITSKVLQKEYEGLLNTINDPGWGGRLRSTSVSVGKVTLKNGKTAEVQILITTDEDDFID